MMNDILMDIDFLIYETDFISYIEERVSSDKILNDFKRNPIPEDEIVDKEKLDKAKKKLKETRQKLKDIGIPSSIIDKKQKLNPSLIQNTLDELEETGKFKSLAIGSVILLVVYHVALGLINFFKEYVNNNIAIFLTMVVIAPITEELGKYLATKFKSTGGHFIVFNAFEFTKYMIYYSSTMPVIQLLLVRSLAVGMHLVNTLIHKRAREKSDKEGNSNEARKGLLITILIHAAWNGLLGGGFFSLLKGLGVV